jgi:uncharacterized protein with von Willebrand factor type A (vWA) domain
VTDIDQLAQVIVERRARVVTAGALGLIEKLREALDATTVQQGRIHCSTPFVVIRGGTVRPAGPLRCTPFNVRRVPAVTAAA